MDLIQFLIDQGVSKAMAEELVERKQREPNLTGVVVGGRYVKLASSSGHKFDEMVRRGIPPASNTDREFLEGNCNGSQFADQPDIGDNYRRECEAAGGSTLGKKYISQLARFPGDNQAWVSGRGDVQKVLEERGWGCDGSVKVKERERTEPCPKPTPIADHAIDRATANEIGGGEISVGEYKKIRAKVKRRITQPSKRD